MFTGIITDIGVIEHRQEVTGGLRLKIATHYEAETISVGASIACAGVCLTVVECGREKSHYGGGNNWFAVEAWEEALRLTTLGSWQPGDFINLERSLKVGDELGGHIVSGHVDGTAEIIEEQAEGEAVRLCLKVPPALARFIAAKGSVCLDGTSLTVNSVKNDIFDILLIRHTRLVTMWGRRRTGDKVNIEIDPLARYIARLAEYQQNIKPYRQ